VQIASKNFQPFDARITFTSTPALHSHTDESRAGFFVREIKIKSFKSAGTFLW
jgi:hypothetical protein